MSPTRDSITISSSSSPTRRRPCRASPSGSTTENMPPVGNGARRRYGQALRTGRGVSSPVSRSHRIRGANSATSPEP